MAETRPQTFANHARFDALFHFFLVPIFGIALILCVVHFFAHITEGDFRDHFHAFLLIVLASGLLVAVFKIRLYALKVQDRVIRLEEQQRLMSLLPETLRVRISEFTVDQLIALRFASDPELPKLAERVLNERLSRAEIKKAIQTWRPDYWRI